MVELYNDIELEKLNAILKKRMLQLPDILLKEGRILLKKDFLEVLGMERQHLTNIKNTDRNFSKNHIYLVCKKYKVNANWLYGLEKNPFRIT